MTMTEYSRIWDSTVIVNAGTLIYDGRGVGGSALIVNSSGALTGVGTIHSLYNYGILSPGNASNTYGTMHASNQFANYAGSLVIIHVDEAGDCSKIAVGTGIDNVTLSGGTIGVIAASSSNYTVGQTYHFLTTTGNITGSGFDSTVLSNSRYLEFGLFYGTDYVDLTLTRIINYVDRANTFNQRSVGSYLDQHKWDPTGDFATVLDEIFPLSDANSRTAFDAMGGELHASLGTVAVENAENFVMSVAQRLRGRLMFDGMPARTAQTKWNDSLVQVSRSQSWASKSAIDLSTWIEGFGAGGSLNGNGNASGLDYSSGGFALGAEKWLDEGMLVGVATGYSNTYALLDERGDRGTIDTWHLALYLEQEFNEHYLTSILAFGYNDYDTRRHVDVGSLIRTAEANYGGTNFSLYTEVGRNLLGQFINLQPYAALEYIQVHRDAFSESGADSLDLTAGGTAPAALRSLLGARALSYLLPDLAVEGRAAWRYDFLNGDRVLDAAFANQSGAAFTIDGVNVDRSVGIFGGSLAYDLTASMKLRLSYDYLLGGNYTAHAGSGSLAFAW